MVKHYNTSEIETIDFIEQVIKDYPPEMVFHIGNAIKYLARAPNKASTADDLYKLRNTQPVNIVKEETNVNTSIENTCPGNLLSIRSTRLTAGIRNVRKKDLTR